MNKPTLVAVGIRSAHNVGAFYRTCDGFGADLVLSGITPRPSGDKYDDRLPHVRTKMDSAIAKTALGAEKAVAWRYFATIDAAIASLRAEGYAIAAIEQSDTSINIDLLQSDVLTALLVGPEVDGLSQEVLDQCDAIYEIPMAGSKESLNVSIAAGIALYQATA